MSAPAAPTAEILLHGYSAGGDQGSLGLCSVHLVLAPLPDGGVRRILFDCGHVGRRRVLLNALRRHGLTPSDIDVLVLSHGHWDHLQNADLFTAARVLMHPAERRALAAPLPHDHVTPPWAAAVLTGLDVHDTGEGDEPAPGVRVIELPGHTAGSIGLTVAGADGLLVLTGDAVATADSLRTGRNANVFHDAVRADASIARVRALGGVVLPGHDRPFRVVDGTPAHLEGMPPFTLRVARPDEWKAATRFEQRPPGARFLLDGARDHDTPPPAGPAAPAPEPAESAPAAGHPRPRTAAEVDELARRLSNWGRWGEDDQLGTVNLITPAKTAEAAALVRTGRIVELGVPLDRHGPQITGSTRFNPLHFMTALHDHDSRPDGTGVADDVIVMPLQAGTQWDALAHYSYRGLIYGGRPASSVTTRGATAADISQVSGRIATRGVLLDIPPLVGVESLRAGQPVTVAELERAERAAGVTAGEGDALLVRTGFLSHCRERGWVGYKGDSPGLDVDTLAWIHERGIAAVATDTTFTEVRPSTVEGVRGPFHLVALVHLGLLIGEVFDLDELATACREAGTAEFLLVAPPLPVTGAVGSPVNPYAVL